MTFHKITTLKTEKSEISSNVQTFSQKLSILSFSTQFFRNTLNIKIRAVFLRNFYAQISTQISCAIFPRKFFALFLIHFFALFSRYFLRIFFALFSHIQNHVKSVQKPKNSKHKKNIKARAQIINRTINDLPARFAFFQKFTQFFGFFWVFVQISLIFSFLRYFWRFYNGAGNSAENCVENSAENCVKNSAENCAYFVRKKYSHYAYNFLRVYNKMRRKKLYFF